MSATLRIAAGAPLEPLRRRPDAVPERVLERTVTVDRERLAAYDRVCGLSLADALPATYPHVLAFPLALELMAAGDFPFGALGLVHVRNAIEQLRPLDASEPLDVRVWAERLAAHPRGSTVDVVAEASAGGPLAWRGRSTYLHREHAAAADGASAGRAAAPPASAVWRVPADAGRRYAAVSGDRNPIHLHAVTARLLGQPAAIAHGMWTHARCLAALEGRLPEAFTVEVAFKRPVRLPADVAFATWHDAGERRFALHDPRNGAPHLEGAVSAAASPAAAT